MSFNQVNNNQNIDANAYRKQIIEKLAVMSDEEKIALFSMNAGGLLAQKAEYDVPENGKFTKSELTFKIPGTQNEAHYFIVHDPIEPKDQRRFSIGVTRDGSDRLTAIQLKKGTKKEILEFLQDKNNADLFKNTLMEASNSTDEYFS